jgi:hypothetical protein
MSLLTPLNASVDPTAIVYSNYVLMVCPSRKSTVCSSPCTISSNINNILMSTSDKPPSKAINTTKHPRKVWKIAYINSLRNEVQKINLLVTDDIRILTISETHLDNTCDTVVAVHGYNIKRNANGGGVAAYIQSHISVKVREDLMKYYWSNIATGSPASPKAHSFWKLLYTKY